VEHYKAGQATGGIAQSDDLLEALFSHEIE
jgi:hypothetical protein